MTEVESGVLLEGSVDDRVVLGRLLSVRCLGTAPVPPLQVAAVAGS